MAEGTDWFLTGNLNEAPAMESATVANADPDAGPDAVPAHRERPGESRNAAGTGTRPDGRSAADSARPEPTGTANAWWPDASGGGAWVDWPVFDRYALRPGDRLEGPAIVAERESTTLLPAGDTARVTARGNLLIKVEAATREPGQ